MGSSKSDLLTINKAGDKMTLTDKLEVLDPDGNVVFTASDTGTATRVKFEPLGGSWDLKWDHDYPRAENHFMKILDEVTAMHPRLDGSNIHSFDDPEIFKFPVAYVSEPGFWTMSPEEMVGVREYVNKGGFVIFDDFTRGIEASEPNR